jgi:hypothetical protein
MLVAAIIETFDFAIQDEYPSYAGDLFSDLSYMIVQGLYFNF